MHIYTYIYITSPQGGIPGFTARRATHSVRCPLSSAFAPRRRAKAAAARLEVVHDQDGSPGWL